MPSDQVSAMRRGDLIFFVDGQSFHRGMTKSGDWSYQVKLPTGIRAGSHDLRAQCKGTNFKPAKFHISHSRKVSFNVSPDTIHAGGKVYADGNGCRRHACGLSSTATPSPASTPTGTGASTSVSASPSTLGGDGTW